MDEKARLSVSLVQIQAVLWILLIQHWCAHPLSGGRGSRRREGMHLLYRGVSHPPRSGGGGIMKEGGRDVRLVTITSQSDADPVNHREGRPQVQSNNVCCLVSERSMPSMALASPEGHVGV